MFVTRGICLSFVFACLLSRAQLQQQPFLLIRETQNEQLKLGNLLDYAFHVLFKVKATTFLSYYYSIRTFLYRIILLISYSSISSFLHEGYVLVNL